MGNARRLTGVAGRWSAGHPWTAIAAWIGAVVATAGVVTAAAVVMVFVFLTFATLSMVQLKEMGVGLAVAVLLDATVVRAVLLPTVMKLLGPRDWYLPRWLGWLPRSSRPAPPPVPSIGPPPVTRVRA
jgi:putative drug exporter of the RND superfamily